MSNGSLLCQPPGTGYRPDLDGLRAIAVLAVVAYHAFPEQAPGGYVGVDVFFVISGFLITNIILDALSRHGFRLREFYARRARRILPALCLVLATCLAFGCYVLLPDEFSNLSKHTAAAAGFAANIAFWRESGYFAPAAQFEPLLHLWSLGIEEQFYLLWPLLLLLAWRLRWRLVPTVALLGAASFALNVIMTNRQATGLYYFPFSRFWELAVGCLLASARVRVASARAVPAAADSPGARASTSRVPARIPGALANAVAIAGVALIAIAAFGFDAHTPFPGFAALVPIAGASCIVAAPGSWFRERVLSHPWLVFVGLVSYPLYLWHWPILSFAAILHAGTPEIGVRVAGLALSFVLAVLTYRLLELPIRKRRRPSVSVALAGAAAALGLAGVAIYAHGGFADRFDANVREIAELPKKDSLCEHSVPRQDEFNYCRRTSPAPPQVVFLGDSQAQGVFEGVADTLGPGYSLLLLGRGGCPPVLNVRASTTTVFDSDASRRDCNLAWRTFVSYVRQTRPPLVVLVGAGARFFHPPQPQATPQPQAAAQPQAEPRPQAAPQAQSAQAANDARAFEDGLTNLLRSLRPYSRVVYLLEIPTFDSSPKCFLRPVRLPGTTCSPRVGRDELSARRTGYRTAVLEAKRRTPGLLVIDPLPALCTSSACSQVSRSGQVLYRDEMHLSPTGGRRVAQRSGLTRVITNNG